MLMVRDLENDYFTAGNPNSKPQELDELSNSDSVRVRRRVAENKNTCLNTLFRLLFDTEAEVRLASAENPIAPMFFTEYLIRGFDDDVKYSLAENANLKLEQLKILAQDDNPYIRERARKAIKSRFRVCGDISGYQKAC